MLTKTARPSRVRSALVADRWVLGIVLAGFVLMGVWYSLVIPPFETPDEIYHYAYARNVAQGHGLPVQSPLAPGPWQHEGGQAPLYYLTTGLLTSGIDQSDFDRIDTINPRSNMGDPLYPGNKNRMLYSAAPHPLQGANLALHIGRWLSVLIWARSLSGLSMRRPSWPFPASALWRCWRPFWSPRSLSLFLSAPLFPTMP